GGTPKGGGEHTGDPGKACCQSFLCPVTSPTAAGEDRAPRARPSSGTFHVWADLHGFRAASCMCSAEPSLGIQVTTWRSRPELRLRVTVFQLSHPGTP
ncbi:unnamed protein product, partial [Gulo gulo]